MELISLESIFQKMGYWAKYRASIDVLFCSIITSDDFEATEKMTQIEIKEGKYICTYFNVQMPIINTFDTSEALIDFVKKHYQSLKADRATKK
ncbi:hypothetical protein JMG10_19395 [Nostoc ellipsosporum NOK]|nr:hypothetical protein [Nostoc ellipsosporum NOK]